MDKPRVILADCDFSYLIPLQLRFADKFGDKIDLEIIDDRDYLGKLFSAPQDADVLAISEDLYDMSMRVHNIGHIFVLTEQSDEPHSNQPNVDYVFKYTNIKEVFNKISGPVSPKEEKEEPQIIMVSSASGGVGKTTIALGICGCLTRSYKKVLYINASRVQSFQRFFDNQGVITSAEVYSTLMDPGEDVYLDIRHVIRNEKFSYLPAFKMALISLGLEYSVFEKIAVSAKKSGDYDYIVVDADNTFDADCAHLMNTADKVILVTEQGKTSVYAMNRLVANINGVSNGKYFFICNNFDKDMGNALVSSESQLKFSVNDYVEHFNYYDRQRFEDFSKDSGLQRIAVLIM